MRAGQLRHRLTIQSRATTQDSFGSKQNGWSNDSEVWGGIRPLSVTEGVEAQKQVGSVSHKITLRAPGLDVGPEKRIKFGDRIFEVVGQMNWDERGEMLQVMCKETT